MFWIRGKVKQPFLSFLCPPAYLNLLLSLGLWTSYFFPHEVFIVMECIVLLCFLVWRGWGEVLLLFVPFLFLMFFLSRTQRKITNNGSFSLNYFLYRIPIFLKWRFLITLLLTISFLSWMYLELNFLDSNGFGVCGVWWSFFSQKYVPLSPLGLLQQWLCLLLALTICPARFLFFLPKLSVVICSLAFRLLCK